MNYEKNDNSFDKFMVFMTTHANSIVTEWFKICSWILICSTIIFLYKVTKDSFLLLLVIVCILMIVVYGIFHFQKLAYSYTEKISNDNESFWKRTLKNGLSISIALFLGYFIIFSSFKLALLASEILHNKSEYKKNHEITIKDMIIKENNN